MRTKSTILILVISCYCCQLMAQSDAGLFRLHQRYHTGTALPRKETAQMDSALSRFYHCWKKTYLVPIPDSSEDYILFHDKDQKKIRCTSEAQGYGMSIIALMGAADDSAKFIYQRLFRYWQLHRIPTGLMGWAQMKAGGANKDATAASDGDIDIAYSLLLADQQWHSSAQFPYRQAADTLIRNIMKYEINHSTWTVLIDADGEKHMEDIRTSQIKDKETDDYRKTRTSDFMPATFKVFGIVTGDPNWQRVVDSTYALFNKMQMLYSSGTGLLPDFISRLGTSNPHKGEYPKEPHSERYYNNACRVPWRIATDYLVTGDKRAKAILNPMNSWVDGAAHGDPDSVFSGYETTGEAKSRDNELYYTIPFGISAMIDTTRRRWVDKVWDWSLPDHHFMAKDPPDYFGENIKMLTMIVMSGNYWTPVKLKAE
jgi:endo-1,4-beta-D-glucanase Y